MYIPLIGGLYWSSKNGLILCTNRGEVIVRGRIQTSVNYGELWTPPLRDIPSPKEVRTMLLLGLAGGGLLPTLCEQFSNATVTAVEHDEQMVKIAQSLSQDRARFPTVIVDDAYEALKKLDRHFDCIIIDLFFGRTLPSFLEEAEFWNCVKQRLTLNGTVVLNISEASYEGAAAESIFPTHSTKRVWHNTFILYA